MQPMETLMAYLAADRRRAMLLGKEPASRSVGTALWADLSGFTPLAEALVGKLGARQGAEELGAHLNRFYDALIAPVDSYDGSVVGFGGDAIMCWFDGDDGRRALGAAQAMQAAMEPLSRLEFIEGEIPSLGIKIAISSGPVRRFRVGDRGVQYLDILTGTTLNRLAALGQLAGAGEILLDEFTEAQLRASIRVHEWRVSPETGHRAAVLASLETGVEPALQVAEASILSEELVRPWLLPAVFARLRAGQGEFLTELRPAVALFLRFEGLDYEGDEQVEVKLDAVVREVQRVLVDYDGTLLQLTIDDKGSYLYAAFGAPVAHEDDVMRAVTASLRLCKLPEILEGIRSVSIGLSRGVMRTGAYGGATRRTYGVLGDDVNLAARLMEHAGQGDVLASETVWQASTPSFDWKRLPRLKLKGRREAIKPARLLGSRIQETTIQMTAMPMIGRQAELARVEAKLELARQGKGQIVSITGEAGMGKSRLLAEVLRRATKLNLNYYSGECQSYGTQSTYLVWQSIWRSFFKIDPTKSPAEQIEMLEKALERIDPGMLQRLPLLGAALNLNIAENEFTKSLDALSRKTLRETLLVDCLRAWTGAGPLVFILEDVHWIDALSGELLEIIGHAIKELPVLVLLAYRPQAEALPPGLARVEHSEEVRLAELTRDETGQLIAARLAHFGMEGPVPPALVERLLAHGQGNPFYIEELLNYQHDRGRDPRDERAWEQGDLPDSLQSMILSRIDQLSEHQQITLKTASVIGRLFRVAWLHGYYPLLGGPAVVSADLQVLDRMEFITQEAPEPQLAYLFKHVITQEVAYESLAYATRASLHGQFALYLEQVAGQDVTPYLDLLAFHYERSENLDKKREYLRKAGEAAQAAYANEAALSYLGRALALAPETDFGERYDLVLKRVKIYAVLGAQEPKDADLTTLAQLANALDDNSRRAETALYRSDYFEVMGNYPEAVIAGQRALEYARLAGSDEHEARSYIALGQVLFRQANFVEARNYAEQALALAQPAKLNTIAAYGFNLLGILDLNDSDYDAARIHLEQGLQLDLAMGNRRAATVELFNLGELAHTGGDYSKAQGYYEQVLDFCRVMGDQRHEALTLVQIGYLMLDQRLDYPKVAAYIEQAEKLLSAVDDQYSYSILLSLSGYANHVRHDFMAARRDYEKCLRLAQELGFRSMEGNCLEWLGDIADELGEFELASGNYDQALAIYREIGNQDGLGQVLTALGAFFYHSGDYEAGEKNARQAVDLALEKKNKLELDRALLGLGRVQQAAGALDDAAVSYRQALALELGLEHLDKPAQTGLAWIELMRGKPVEALAEVDQILKYLETHDASTRDETIWIYLGCYRILEANADQRARPILETAHRRLQEIAAKIDDETLKASYLQNVPFNREILQAWEDSAQH